MHSNIRGIDSKMESLGTILNIIQPDVLTINETLFVKNRKLTLQGYSYFTSNRTCVSGGGIASCVKANDMVNTLKVGEGENDHEMLVTRHSQFVRAINVINIYGAVENRSNKDDILSRWT